MAIRRASKSSISTTSSGKRFNLVAGYSPAVDEMDLIERVTVGAGGVTSIVLGSGGTIPQRYQHLQIRGIASSVNAGNRATDTLYFRINGDSGSNYAWHAILGNGGSASAPSDASGTRMLVENIPGTTVTQRKTCFIIDILDYSSTSKNKSIRTHVGEETNETNGAVRLLSGIWVSTAAITSLTFYGNTYNLDQHSTISLYGVVA